MKKTALVNRWQSGTNNKSEQSAESKWLILRVEYIIICRQHLFSCMLSITTENKTICFQKQLGF